MPLMAWSRQSEVTADRAGLLAVGDVALARRVLLTWSIRSASLAEAGQHRGVDEAGGCQRRPVDAHLRDDHFIDDVYRAAAALPRPGGARDRAHAMERKHPARAQAVFRGLAETGAESGVPPHAAQRPPQTPFVSSAPSARTPCGFRLLSCAARPRSTSAVRNARTS